MLENKLLLSFSQLSGRIGLLGGSFDPVQLAHVAIAEAAFRHHALDHIVFIPAAQNPLKEFSATASAADRLAMLLLATKEQKNFWVSDIELKHISDNPSYSVDTVNKISKQTDKTSKLFFIIGSDNLPSLYKWKDIDRLFELCQLVTVNRDGISAKQVSERAPNLNPLQLKKLSEFFIDIEPISISSTSLRKKLSRGEKLENSLNPAVLQHIKKHRLYQTSS